MKIFSALLSLFCLDALPQKTRVYRGVRPKAFGPQSCPGCSVTTAREGQCLNRMCEAFNGRQAQTHPDLLSLDRATRMNALMRWERGGMAALFAR